METEKFDLALINDRILHTANYGLDQYRKTFFFGKIVSLMSGPYTRSAL